MDSRKKISENAFNGHVLSKLDNVDFLFDFQKSFESNEITKISKHFREHTLIENFKLWPLNKVSGCLTGRLTSRDIFGSSPKVDPMQRKETIREFLGFRLIWKQDGIKRH